MPRRRPSRTLTRAQKALVDVLPFAVRPLVVADDSGAGLVVGERSVEARWVGEGDLGDVRRVLADRERPDVVVGRRLSPGARDALAQAGVSWVDETGAAEVALGMIVISRSGRVAQAPPRPARWAPATLAVAECLLTGTEATVSAVRVATDLSTGSCTTALRALTDLGLLDADARRGRASGRRVRDRRALLAAYVAAADALRAPTSLQVGVTWRDPIAGLLDTGRRWTGHGVGWCATGAAAAAVLAPHLTTFGTTEVYVSADTLPGLEAIAADVGLKPIEGGRLTLRPMPTVAVARLATEIEGLRVAPWPRVYVDLRGIGVRGEEAAENLWEVMDGGRG